MSTNFPTSLDTLTNPYSTDKVATVSHSSQHSNANDAIEALEAKVGADGSAVTTSHDYKLSEVTSTDKAVGKTATQTLTNKTLTTPTIGDFSNANHNHTNSAGGGTLGESALLLSDNTTNDVSTSKHGFVPKAPNDTTKYLRGDGTWASVSQSASVTFIPQPQGMLFANTSSGDLIVNSTISSNTTMSVGRVSIPYSMTSLTKISFLVNSVSVAGTVKVALFSEDGQTKMFEATTASISGGGLITTTISATITPGIYYIAIVPVSTTNIEVSYWKTKDYGSVSGFGVASKAVLEGTVTVTAGTVPSTITPSSITYATGKTLVVRLDV